MSYVLDHCPVSAAADDEAHRLGQLDERDMRREAAATVVANEIRAQVLGRLEHGLLERPVASFFKRHNASNEFEPVETTVRTIDALMDHFDSDAVRQLLADVLASPVAKDLRSALALAVANENATEVAQARGWMV